MHFLNHPLLLSTVVGDGRKCTVDQTRYKGLHIHVVKSSWLVRFGTHARSLLGSISKEGGQKALRKSHTVSGRMAPIQILSGEVVLSGPWSAHCPISSQLGIMNF